jgi:hypothetical protein
MESSSSSAAGPPEPSRQVAGGVQAARLAYVARVVLAITWPGTTEGWTIARKSMTSEAPGPMTIVSVPSAASVATSSVSPGWDVVVTCTLAG